MKKHLTTNMFLSLSLLGALFFFSHLFNWGLEIYHYSVIIFFMIIYFLQSIILFNFSKTSIQFVSIYNFTTMFKMGFSALFLVAYYVLFAHLFEAQQNIRFTLFFLGTYFLYLTINTTILFSRGGEKKD